MRRRDFIKAVAGSAMTWPLTARAQQSKPMPVIGFLGSQSPDVLPNALRAFHQGLSEVGYAEGRNVTIEYRWAQGQNDRLPALVADLVHRQATVLVASDSTPAALAAKAATTTIPIVFVSAADPVQAGLVASLSRPGGNVTGVTTLNVEVASKRLELLHELVPTAATIAFLVNPTNPVLADTLTRDIQAAAGRLGIKLHVFQASTEREFDTAFETIGQLHADGLVIGTDIFFNSRIEQLAALAVRQALPAVYQSREFVAAGGLLSYGASLTDASRQAGIYTGRILRGEKPSDLPVQRLTSIELFINLKSAKALSITVPLPMSGRADEVIE